MRDGLFRGSTEGSRALSRNGNSVLARRNIDASTTAKLFIIPPMHKPDAIIRPLSYNIDAAFLDEIRMNVHSARDGRLGDGGIGTQRERMYLKGLSSANEAIMPSKNSFRFGRRAVNDLYRFILVVNNAPLNARSRYSAVARNQVNYTGYFVDDPISRSGHLNYSADMVFVSMSQIDIDDRVGPNGYAESGTARCIADILPKDTLDFDSNSSTDRDYLIGPDHVIDSILNVEDDDDSLYSGIAMSPDATQLSRMPQSKTMLSIFSAPRQQLNRIVTSLTKTILSSERDSTRRGLADGRLGEISLPSDAFLSRRRFRTNLEGEIPSKIVGPEYYKRINIAKLLSLYPMIKDNTTVLDIDAPSYNAMDEEDDSLFSVMSSYLKTSLPPVFADHGLDSLSFRYATSDPRDRFRSKANREPVWDIMTADPFIEESMQETRDRVDDALRYTKEMVFDTVESICGEIEVFVDYRSGDDTIVQLQMRDMTDEINYEYAIHHGDLGGMVSPLIGGPDEYENASNVVSTLLDCIDEEAGSFAARQGDRRVSLLRDDVEDYEREDRRMTLSENEYNRGDRWSRNRSSLHLED